jgi:hypothetical protein
MPRKPQPFEFYVNRALTHLHTKYTVSASGCWLWNQSVDPRGYGIATIGKKTFKMHRFTAQYLKGLNIQGLFVCHTCDMPGCINPEHLWVGTHQENMNDMVSKNRHPHCGRNGVSIITPHGCFPSMVATQTALGISLGELLIRLRKMPDQYKRVNE